jgi:hypothetical protein
MSKYLWFRPEDRPTAGEIAAELFDAIDNLPEGFGDEEKWRREREREDRRMIGEKRVAEGADDEEVAVGRTVRAHGGRARRDGASAKRTGRAPEDGTRRDGAAVERRGRVLEDGTRRNGIAVEKDRTGAREKNTFGGI